MASTESIGVTFAASPVGGALPAQLSSAGAPAFEASAPYLMSDGKSLVAPVLVYDAGGPIGEDAAGRPLDALPLKMGAAPEPVEWQPFTLTAGDSGEWFGYSSGDLASPPFNPPMGSISNEPNRLHPLEAMYVDLGDGAPVAIFHGDMQASAAGLRVQIDGYHGTASGASMFAGNTVIRFSPARGALADGKTYGVVFALAGGWDD